MWSVQMLNAPGFLRLYVCGINRNIPGQSCQQKESHAGRPHIVRVSLSPIGAGKIHELAWERSRK